MKKRDVVNDIEKKIKLIDEKNYQQYKKERCKKDDYFSLKELMHMLEYRGK